MIMIAEEGGFRGIVYDFSKEFLQTRGGSVCMFIWRGLEFRIGIPSQPKCSDV